MRGFRGMLLGLMVSVGAIAGAKAQTVEIEYWQYVFDTRVKAMNELIKRSRRPTRPSRSSRRPSPMPTTRPR